VRSVTPKQEFPFLTLRHRRLYLLSPTPTTPWDQPFGMFPDIVVARFKKPFPEFWNRLGQCSVSVQRRFAFRLQRVSTLARVSYAIKTFRISSMYLDSSDRWPSSG
jgi:hypothetical protein